MEYTFIEIRNGINLNKELPERLCDSSWTSFPVELEEEPNSFR